MPLVVQTHPQTPGANSYGDVVGFKAYHDLRLQDYSAYTDAQIEAACAAGTEYLDMRFLYHGYKTAAEQTTEFPRNSLYNTRGDLVQGVPANVVKASYEYAIRWLRNGFTLLPDPSAADSAGGGAAVKSTEVEVGPVRTKTEYAVADGAVASTSTLPDYPYPDRQLKSQGYVSTGSVGGVGSHPTGRG
jgi:hypothetical protein